MLVLYLILGVAGGVTYLVYTKNARGKAELPPTKPSAVAEKVVAPAPEMPPTEANPPAPSAESAADAMERRINELAAGMETLWISGNKMYHYEQDSHPPTGVYWRPFIMENKWGPTMKNDIYYFASVSDGGFYDWIRGDALAVETGDYSGVLYLPDKERHDKLSSDAESLYENYVLDADEEVLTAYRAIRNAQGGRITYYNQANGKSLTSYLTGEEVSRISAMIELYDLLLELYR